jgi:hypothetical protein
MKPGTELPYHRQAAGKGTKLEQHVPNPTAASVPTTTRVTPTFPATVMRYALPHRRYPDHTFKRPSTTGGYLRADVCEV